MLLRSLISNRSSSLSRKWWHVPVLRNAERGHCQQCKANQTVVMPRSAPLLGQRDPLLRSRLSPPTNHHVDRRFLSSTNHTLGLKKSTSVPPDDDSPGVITRALDMLGLTGKLRFNRYKMRFAGWHMYKSCADGIDVEQFFRACNMKDTLFSFFLVVELHVWMCLARLKQEGREGKYMTHYLVTSMWHDIQERGRVMGISSAHMRNSLGKMAEQFNGSLFAYDEGILSTDAVLAAALWRNLFVRNCEDPQQLLDMVAYFRQQMQYLDALDSAQLLQVGCIKLHHFQTMMQYLDALDSAQLLQVGRIKWLPFQGGGVGTTKPLEKAATLDEEISIPEFDRVPTVQGGRA